MRTPLFLLAAAVLALLAASCEHYDEQPPINLGYVSQVEMPQPEELTHADSLRLDSILAEYEQNAR